MTDKAREPIETYDTIDAMRSACPYHSNELRGAFYDGWMNRERLHPAPRPEFVRLSEEEITELAWAISQKLLGTLSQRVRAVRAIEDALEEKNK